MSASGIKSKPVYEPLCADSSGRYHLMLGFGTGITALARVVAELEASSPASLKHTHALLVPARSSDGQTQHAASLARLQALAHGGVRIFDEADTLLREFRSVLEQSFMGTRLYLAGPESFIGLAMQAALEFNLNKDEIRAEASGTLARRVYCVHCRATTEDVRTNIVSCRQCARWLLVRDHYSRRLAAYMGVMVDAEAPGELPAISEVYG
jgi:ferredoxin-NADP reductase